MSAQWQLDVRTVAITTRYRTDARGILGVFKPGQDVICVSTMSTGQTTDVGLVDRICALAHQRSPLDFRLIIAHLQSRPIRPSRPCDSARHASDLRGISGPSVCLT